MESQNEVQIIPKTFQMPKLYYNAGIYYRVSSHFQDQLNSIASQASFFVNHISRRPGFILRDIYLDFRSGDSIQNRPQFQRMIQDAKEHKIDTIFTKSISRFGRNALENITILRELKAIGVSVIFD